MRLNLKRRFNKFFGIKNTYPMQGFVYLDSNNMPVRTMTTRVRQLDELSIKAYDEDDASREAYSILNSKYPDLRGKIWLF